MGGRVRFDAVLVALLVAVLAAVLLVSRTSNAGSVSSVPSPLPTASAFGRSYLGYLDGIGAVSALAPATPQVQRIAADLGPIPPPLRSGSVILDTASLRYVKGTTTGSGLLSGHDRRHRYRFGISLAFRDGHWRVVYLVAPDLTMVLTPPAAAPAPSAAARTEASRFALAYTAFREGATHSPPPGLAPIAGQIRTGIDPLARTFPHHAPPTLSSVSFGPAQGGVISATAALHDAGAGVGFTFVLKQSAGRWLAWEFPQGGAG